MAIDLPAVRFQASYPELVESVSMSRAGKRVVAAVEYADPFWQVSMRTKPLRASERLLVEAFRDAARNGLVTVHYTPQHQCLPKAYWGSPGAAAIADNGALKAKDGYSVTVESVTNGLVLSPGDLISLTTDDYNWMARVVAGGTAADGEISLTLNVAVPSYIETGAVVRFKDIVANMRLLADSFSMSDGPLPVASFTLVEVPK